MSREEKAERFASIYGRPRMTVHNTQTGRSDTEAIHPTYPVNDAPTGRMVPKTLREVPAERLAQQEHYAMMHLDETIIGALGIVEVKPKFQVGQRVRLTKEAYQKATGIAREGSYELPLEPEGKVIRILLMGGVEPSTGLYEFGGFDYLVRHSKLDCGWSESELEAIDDGRS